MSVLMYLQEYKRTDELDKSRAVVSLANIVYIALDCAHFGERAVSLGWVVLREDCSAYWYLDHIVHGVGWNIDLASDNKLNNGALACNLEFVWLCQRSKV